MGGVRRLAVVVCHPLRIFDLVKASRLVEAGGPGIQLFAGIIRLVDLPPMTGVRSAAALLVPTALGIRGE